MLIGTTSLNQKLQNSQSVKDGFREFLKKFWQFSRFYGQYHSTPIHKRRIMVEEHLHHT
ncbi:MAG TPA: hypothetical protein ACFE0H_01040 [Elainellaceae cyanobacterium]